ncbi:MAG TPA: hypothetical protein PLU30_17605 [Verrucomicrobiae bacterium]|nr:hypothetical protein [Verrucomicrobiae bacterium]
MSDQPQPDRRQPAQSPAGCILHMLWLFGGSLALAFCAIHIVLNHSVRPSVADALFAAFLAGSIAVRYIEIRFFNGTTDDGRPATMADLRRYALRVSLIGGAALGAAHLLAACL